LLSQLTEVGNLTAAKFVERFHELKNCRDVYFVIVIEDLAKGKLAAAGTIFIEKKFIRNAGKVLLFRLSILHRLNLDSPDSPCPKGRTH
jgi:glucosamine-phosphate N-acetyltransferase